MSFLVRLRAALGLGLLSVGPQDAINELMNCILAPSWPQRSHYVDISDGYLILSPQTEGWLACLPVSSMVGEAALVRALKGWRTEAPV